MIPEKHHPHHHHRPHFEWSFPTVVILLLLALVVGLIIYDHYNPHFNQQATYRPPVHDESEITIDPELLKQDHTVYVPAYSHVYFNKGEPLSLTMTLSVRNIDLEQPILIKSVSYYDTNGKLVESFLKKSLTLKPQATAEFLVSDQDTRGGSGANFLVQWASEENVNKPVIEAVMIGTSNQQGISFVRSGVELE